MLYAGSDWNPGRGSISIMKMYALYGIFVYGHSLAVSNFRQEAGRTYGKPPFLLAKKTSDKASG